MKEQTWIEKAIEKLQRESETETYKYEITDVQILSDTEATLQVKLTLPVCLDNVTMIL